MVGRTAAGDAIYLIIGIAPRRRRPAGDGASRWRIHKHRSGCMYTKWGWLVVRTDVDTFATGLNNFAHHPNIPK